MQTKPSVLAIVPAYNEEGSIVATVEEIEEKVPSVDILVVNDGSRDTTAALLGKNHIPHLSLPCNLGLDGAFQAGMKYAYEHGYDFAVQVDGDGQHNPVYIADLLTVAQTSDADIVIGSRFATKKRPSSLRMIGSRFITSMIKLTCKKTIKDPTSGMRLYNKDLIAAYAINSELTPEPDSIAHLLRSGKTVEEVQVEMRERMAGESYLTFTKSIAYMLRVGVSILFVQWFRKKEA